MKRKQPILFYNLKPSVISIFKGVQPKEFIYCKTFNELNDLLKQYADKSTDNSDNSSNSSTYSNAL